MSASGNYIVESDVSNWPDAVSQTSTFSASEINPGQDRVEVGIDVPTGSIIRFTSDGTLPAPLVYGQRYYSIKIDATTIKVAETSANAAAGTSVDITDTGSAGATHTIDVGEGSSTADRQEVIDRVEELIETLTKDYFYAKSFDEYFDGNNKNRLFLGYTADILSITVVEISGIELSSSYYTNDKKSIYLDPTLAEEAYPELHLRLKWDTSLFPLGEGNIHVTGTIGHSSRPAAIKRACIILCEYENNPTLYEGYSPNVTSEEIGEDWGVETKGRYWTGVREADRILAIYIRKKTNFRAI